MNLSEEKTGNRAGCQGATCCSLASELKNVRNVSNKLSTTSAGNFKTRSPYDQMVAVAAKFKEILQEHGL